ncbi:MAG: phospholipase A [Nitrospira sp.]|nr:phospholipase A [Nitrospira sp.]
MRLCLSCLASFCAANAAQAEENAPSAPAVETISTCKAIESDEERLKCYDRAGTAAAAQATEIVPAASLMGTRWELDPGTSHELFSIRPHKQIYLLPARYSTNINNHPSSPTQDAIPRSLDYLSTEVKFQFSFKLKALEVKERFDLWLGYTQLSFFQMYNKARSAPFRESNYEPELMGVIHTDYDLFGLKGRFINLGLVHQSNGRSDPLSRSWNRIYAQFGFERGPFGLTIRPWYRIREGWSGDNNPDIAEYMGRGDLVATYVVDGHTLSLLLRSNLNFWNFHGATQLNWSFPLYHQVKGYVQLFTGYGESLIDYNHYQTTIGAGFLLIDWM